MNSRFQTPLWSPLHALVLGIPPSRLPIFPSLAGSAWFLTLAALLLTWLGHGMPRYPGQSNPDVAFISDIASFELKPLFLVGAAITATGFVVTVAAVHVVRYEPGFALARPCGRHPGLNHTDENRRNSDDGCRSDEAQDAAENEDEDHNVTVTLRLMSLLSILAAAVAGSALVLLAVMDTFRYHRAHSLLALIAAGTAVVYANEVVGFVRYVYHRGQEQRNYSGTKSLKVGVYASLSTAVILVEVFLGMAFISLTIPGEERFRQAGILEWVIAFLGTIYLWLFGGFFDRMSNFRHYVLRDASSISSKRGIEPERRPLLEESSRRNGE